MRHLPKEYQERSGISSGLFQAFCCHECNVKVQNLRFIPESDLVTSLEMLAANVVAREGLDIGKLPSSLKERYQKMRPVDDDSGNEVFVAGWKKLAWKELPGITELTENGQDFGLRQEIIDEVQNIEYHDSGKCAT